ncbi:hypothetical protein [Salinicola sp. CPA57]|uniref:hypothetical protein n=1 Tax=Salinicola sp. CPA57 TaxID=1949080 RepID=UPI000DA15483|nr:hypothetical protein [Salinicola sp. CPA57]
MKQARYGSPAGPAVDPTEFLARAGVHYKRRGIYPYCAACGEVVDLYGVFNANPGTTARFDHKDRPDNANPLDECVLSKRNSRLDFLIPSGFDDDRGERIRQQFRDPEFLALAYNFCLSLCRKGNLSAAQFRDLCKRADKKRIWAYADIRVWSIPYILLVLGDFTATNSNGRQYDFRFVFRKPRGSDLSALWLRPSSCHIEKVFDGGKPLKTDDNPYPVSETDFQMKAGDASWINVHLLRQLDWAA